MVILSVEDFLGEDLVLDLDLVGDVGLVGDVEAGILVLKVFDCRVLVRCLRC